ncbi:MAG: ATP-binding protein [Acidobacteriales bacterium]|nr:ATP-binding protein [Terriglobales bacterium]
MVSAQHLSPQQSPLKTALVVNADPEIESLLKSVLPGSEWRILDAPSNVEVLRLVENRPFDLIITSDDTSAKEDVELLRKIRKVRPHTRLIILANESTPADVIASMREHAFSYFSKPFSLDSFAEMVRLAADGPCWDDGIEVIAATPAWIRLAIRCERSTADRLLQFLHEIADLPEPERSQVAMAFREILLNAFEHGCSFDPKHYVEISYVRTSRMVGCRVRDPGEGFGLDEICHAAIANSPEDPLRHQAHRDALGLRPGGLGVLMAKGLVDDLIYSEDGNDVLLIKYLDPQPAAAA